MADLRIVDFTVSLQTPAKTREDMISLMSKVLKNFNGAESQIKSLSGGYVNAIYKVDFEDTHLIVKIFTDKTEILTRPELIVLSMRAVQVAGLGPDVLAWFTNGVVYGYQEGEMINPLNKEINNPDTRRLIVKKIAAYNQINTESLEIKGYKLPPSYQAEEYLQKSFQQFPDDYDGQTYFKCNLTFTASKNSLMKEHQWLRQEILGLDLKNVFSHGDLWWRNVLYDSDRECVSFIDHDLSGYNPFPMDLASVSLRIQLSVIPVLLPQLSEEEEKSLCKLYIEETRKLQGNSAVVTDNDINILSALVKLFKVYVHFIITSMALTTIYVGDMDLRYIIGPWDEMFQDFKKDYIQFRKAHEDLYIKNWEI